jgi:hypothetical protein
MDHSVHIALKELQDDGVIECKVNPGYSDSEPVFSIVGLTPMATEATSETKEFSAAEIIQKAMADLGNTADENTDDYNEDLEPDADEEDGMEDEQQMKPFAQLVHTVHESFVQIIDMIDEGGTTSEHTDGVNKLAGKGKALLGKFEALLRDVYSQYLADHPDMPPLPDAEMSEMDGNPDELDDDEEMEDDEDDDAEEGDDGLDEDEGWDEEGGEGVSDSDPEDDEDDEEDDEEYKKRKSLKYWRRRSVASHLGYMRQKAIDHGVRDLAVVQKAIDWMNRVATNSKTGPSAKAHAAELAAELELVTKGHAKISKPAAAGDTMSDDDWGGDILAEIKAMAAQRDKLIATAAEQTAQLYAITGQR